MSIEKMIMVNMVGNIKDMDVVTKLTVLSECLQPVSAIHEIDTTDFKLAANEKNIDALIDVCYIKPYVNDRNYNELVNKMKEIKDILFKSNKIVVKDEEIIYEYIELKEKIEDIHNKFKEYYEKLTHLKDKKENVEKTIEHLKYIKDVNVELQEIEQLKNFTFGLYKVNKDSILKLKSNYENIPSIVQDVYKTNEFHIIVTLTPKVLIKEAERIFKSLNCENLLLDCLSRGTPLEIINSLIKMKEKIETEISRIEQEISKISIENERIICILDKSIELEVKSQMIKEHIALTKDFFYMCGWVPKSFLNSFKSKLLEIDYKIIIIEKDYDNTSFKIIPPTRMKNNAFISPFESIVRMYGIPSYNELDPTGFLALSYLFMFGAMFGDLGQGIIFLLIGLFIKNIKKRANLGGVLSRLGISSSIFGLIYGSFFGFEDIIPALIIRPMENITEILIFAVVLGSILIFISFIFSIINSVKKKDMENGLFSRNGIAGFLFYIFFLAFIITKYRNIQVLSNGMLILLFGFLLVVMLLKEPLTNLILNKRPLFHEEKGDYFIEGGFGVVETILSFFSNTLSFIRVGAFALNHVGLFIAFAALANMMKSGIGSISMYILGNIIIIGLEGLIVFIQGLRLEYYELFSKYYEGTGIEFNPVKLNI